MRRTLRSLLLIVFCCCFLTGCLVVAAAGVGAIGGATLAAGDKDSDSEAPVVRGNAQTTATQ